MSTPDGLAPARLEALDHRRWQVAWSRGPVRHVFVRRRQTATPPAGWKLHVSATPATASTVLDLAVPVLLRESVPFKFVATTADLHTLNQGLAGPTQVGKFLTAYPADAEQAVQTARALDAVLARFPGPDIPSDRRICSGPVWYRYGAYHERVMQLPTGELSSVLAHPDGTLVPDRRRAEDAVLPGMEDPFTTEGLGNRDSPLRLLEGRWLLTSALASSARAEVWMAVDVRTRRVHLVKRARHAVPVGDAGLTAPGLLRREARILDHAAGVEGVPEVVALVRDGDRGDLALVMTDVGGEPVGAVVRRAVERGEQADWRQVARRGRELAATLGTLHDRGIVHRDVSAGNVLLRDAGMGLVDFEFAHVPGLDAHLLGRGTAGYASPEQVAGAEGDAGDDIFALGALMYLMACGADPRYAPATPKHLRTVLRMIRPDVEPALVDIVARCMAPQPQRLTSMAEVEDALDRALTPRVRSSRALGFGLSPATRPGPRRDTTTAASALVDRLLHITTPWMESYTASGEMPSPMRPLDFGEGLAGAVVAVALAVEQLARPRHILGLRRLASALAAAERPDPPLAGLCAGEAGIAAALLRAGHVLDDAAVVAAGLERANALSDQPGAHPDFYSGSAGRLRMHLALARQEDASAPVHLATAARLTRALSSGPPWVATPGYSSFGSAACVGYAHGAAGVADCLLDAWDVMGDSEAHAAALRTVDWLGELAEATLPGRAGAAWPVVAGDEPRWAGWCHGSAGVARFLLRAAERGGDAADLALRAASTVEASMRWSGPTQCCGVAGAAELLLEAYLATGDSHWKRAAGELGQLLVYTTMEPPRGPDSESGVGIGWLSGLSGVVTCLLRLDDPTMAHPLSLEGLLGRSLGPGWKEEKVRQLEERSTR